jgi:uncharacterized damage-inducible protein DinB
MKKSLLTSGAVLLMFVAAVRADDAAMAAHQAAKADFLASFDETAKKIRDLAEAIPADKYGWRPAKGVRSIAEVCEHIAGANIYFANALGVALPEGAGDPEAMEKMTDKKDAIANLDKYLAFGRSIAENATPEMLAKEYDFFGSKQSGRGMMLVMFGHMSEHLGQMIAYARSVGVTPPWSK